MWDDVIKLVKEIFTQYNLLLVIAGILSVYITALIKSAVQWKRRAALILSIAAAGGLAILAGWLQGDINSWPDIGQNFIGIFAVAQIFYNGIMYKRPIETIPVVETTK